MCLWAISKKNGSKSIHSHTNIDFRWIWGISIHKERAREEGMRGADEKKKQSTSKTIGIRLMNITKRHQINVFSVSVFVACGDRNELSDIYGF